MKKHFLIPYVILLILFTNTSAHGEVLKVGPGMQFILPSIAAEFAQDGDTVEISAKGFYDEDVAIWKQNNIVQIGTVNCLALVRRLIMYHYGILYSRTYKIMLGHLLGILFRLV